VFDAQLRDVNSPGSGKFDANDDDDLELELDRLSGMKIPQSLSCLARDLPTLNQGLPAPFTVFPGHWLSSVFFYKHVLANNILHNWFAH
jgi:hypothetical protein